MLLSDNSFFPHIYELQHISSQYNKYDSTQCTITKQTKTYHTVQHYNKTYYNKR